MSKRGEAEGRGWNDVDRESAERLLRGERPTDADGPAVAALDRLLSAAVEPVTVDPACAREQEAAVLAAYRAARAAEAAEDPRRRDDWRSRARMAAVAGGRRAGRTVTGVVAAAIALGGVAVAAGTDVLPVPFGSEPAREAPQPAGPASSGPLAGEGDGPSGNSPASSDISAPSEVRSSQKPGRGSANGHSKSGTDTSLKGLCRAYATAADGRGKPLDARSFKRLAEAAGGVDAVGDYCGALGYEREKSGGTPAASGGSEAPEEPEPPGADQRTRKPGKGREPN
jgi:hypothetical protein